MQVLDTYKFKMDWINTKREKRKHQFFRRLRAAKSVVRGRIWSNFKLIQALMNVIITCKYEKGPSRTREKKATPFFKLYHYLLPWKPVVGSGRISNSFKLLCISYDTACKYEKDKIKTAEKM